jgi:prevent-host-death family protein
LNRVAYRGERIVLHRRGKDLAVLVPVEDLARLEELEDREDVRVARRRLANPKDKALPFEQVRRDLGLD